MEDEEAKEEGDKEEDEDKEGQEGEQEYEEDDDKDVDLDADLCDTADPFPFRGSEKWQGDPADEKDTTYKRRQYTKKQTKRKLTRLQVTVHLKSSTMMILFLLPSTEMI